MTAPLLQNSPRMKFGVFMAPFHRVGENPTLAFERDFRLIEHLDMLGFDEAWIGEHHSAGWETIGSPELFIAAVAQRTRQIKLGTGVCSLPYHHPFMVADRMVQLDHMTRGRTLFGVGPGALTSDAYMLCIDPLTQRRRMDEALGVILRLFRGESVTCETDWFAMREARLQLAPYSYPHMPVAVASSFSPAGPTAAGKYGIGMLSITAAQRGGIANAANSWLIAEEEAARNGTSVRREDWRLLVSMHLSESREEALADVRVRCEEFNAEYYGRVVGRPNPDGSPTVEQLVDAGGLIAGTPDDAIAAIERIQEMTGSFGGLLLQMHEWTSWEKTLHSYDLWARYVAPHFQGQLQQMEGSRDWVAENRSAIFTPTTAAIGKAFADAGRELPEAVVQRMQRGSS